MKKRSILFGLLVVVLALPLVVVGCLTGADSGTGGSVDQDQNNRLSALESWKGTADSKLATYTNQEDKVTELRSQLDEEKAAREELESSVSTLESELADLQDVVDSGNSNSSSSGEVLTTRWAPSVDFDDLDWDEDWYDIDIDVHPRSIREADTYSISVEVKNELELGEDADGTGGLVDAQGTLVGLDDVTMWVSFSSSSRDTRIDTYNTGLYFTGEEGVSSTGSIFFDSEFSPSDGVDCRWMEFVSEEFDIDELEVGDTMKITFDFDLYYVE